MWAFYLIAFVAQTPNYRIRPHNIKYKCKFYVEIRRNQIMLVNEIDFHQLNPFKMIADYTQLKSSSKY
jgi:hypothetical protein